MSKYLIKGKLYDPIHFGDEDEDWVGDGENPTCGDCGCHLGEQHLVMCDIERCPCCGLQLISCNCGVIYELDDEKLKNIDYYIDMQKRENIEQEKMFKKLEEEIYSKKNNKDKNNQDTEM